MERGPLPRNAGSSGSPVLAAAASLMLLCFACKGERPEGSLGSSAAELVASAYPAFAAARDRAWPPPSAVVVQARQIAAQGRPLRARTMLEQELAAHPDNDEARLFHSELLYQEAQLGPARRGFERILENGPSFAGSEYAFPLYGLCLMRLGESAGAREAFLAFEKLRPGQGNTYWSLGELDLQEGQPDRAIARFEQALAAYEVEQRPDRAACLARVHAGLGEARQQKGELEAAREALEASLALDPEQAAPYYELSRVLTRLGDAEGAQRALREFERLRSRANRPSPAKVGGQ